MEENICQLSVFLFRFIKWNSMILSYSHSSIIITPPIRGVTETLYDKFNVAVSIETGSLRVFLQRTYTPTRKPPQIY